jgi:cytochrome c oxidase accessory protein FixG
MDHDLAEPKVSYFADRVRVYPRSVRGPVRRAKWAILVACLAIYYLLPWLRWDRGPGQPSQAILLDLQNERFHFFNLVLWPQDIYFLTGLLIMAAVALFLVTSLFGRVWCGYTCPQTVWTDLFLLVERIIEGDRNERMKRDQGPASFDRAWRKTLKHAVWLGVAFWTGGAWIMYYVDAPTVTWEFWHGEASAPVYIGAGLLTATTYLLAGWAREQVCTFMCPWPRFQAAMLDEQSLTVTYQAWRGEPRAHGKRLAAAGTPRVGDCVDCLACVNVCPTGVDIRDGSQLGCINCGLCVDACNEVMERTHQPRGLITWDTFADQKARQAGGTAKLRLLRPRTFIYLGALLAGGLVMGTALALHGNLEMTIEHDRAPLFVRVPDGAIRNAYGVRIVNKAQGATAFTLSVSGVPGAQLAMGQEGQWRTQSLVLPVPSDTVANFRVLVFAQPAPGAAAQAPISFTLRNATTGAVISGRAIFIGPSKGALP